MQFPNSQQYGNQYPSHPGNRPNPTENWKVFYTPENTPYYYNEITKETSWTCPPGFNTNPVPPLPPPSNLHALPPLLPPWQQFFSGSVPYYYNTATKETTWEHPMRKALPPIMNPPIAHTVASVAHSATILPVTSQQTGSNSSPAVVAPTPSVISQPISDNTVSERLKAEAEKKRLEQIQKEKEKRKEMEDQRKLENEKRKQERLEKQMRIKKEQEEQRRVAEEKRRQKMQMKLTGTINPNINSNVDQETANKNFFELLKEKRIKVDEAWSDVLTSIVLDPRYVAISSVAQKKKLFLEYQQNLSDSRVKGIKEDYERQLSSVDWIVRVLDHYYHHNPRNISHQVPDIVADYVREHNINISDFLKDPLLSSDSTQVSSSDSEKKNEKKETEKSISPTDKLLQDIFATEGYTYNPSDPTLSYLSSSLPSSLIDTLVFFKTTPYSHDRYLRSLYDSISFSHLRRSVNSCTYDLVTLMKEITHLEKGQEMNSGDAFKQLDLLWQEKIEGVVRTVCEGRMIRKMFIYAYIERVIKDGCIEGLWDVDDEGHSFINSTAKSKKYLYSNYGQLKLHTFDKSMSRSSAYSDLDDPNNSLSLLNEYDDDDVFSDLLSAEPSDPSDPSDPSSSVSEATDHLSDYAHFQSLHYLHQDALLNKNLVSLWIKSYSERDNPRLWFDHTLPLENLVSLVLNKIPQWLNVRPEEIEAVVVTAVDHIFKLDSIIKHHLHTAIEHVELDLFRDMDDWLSAIHLSEKHTPVVTSSPTSTPTQSSPRADDDVVDFTTLPGFNFLSQNGTNESDTKSEGNSSGDLKSVDEKIKDNGGSDESCKTTVVGENDVNSSQTTYMLPGLSKIAQKLPKQLLQLLSLRQIIHSHSGDLNTPSPSASVSPSSDSTDSTSSLYFNPLNYNVTPRTQLGYMMLPFPFNPFGDVMCHLETNSTECREGGSESESENGDELEEKNIIHPAFNYSVSDVIPLLTTPYHKWTSSLLSPSLSPSPDSADSITDSSATDSTSTPVSDRLPTSTVPADPTVLLNRILNHLRNLNVLFLSPPPILSPFVHNDWSLSRSRFRLQYHSAFSSLNLSCEMLYCRSQDLIKVICQEPRNIFSYKYEDLFLLLDKAVLTWNTRITDALTSEQRNLSEMIHNEYVDNVGLMSIFSLPDTGSSNTNTTTSSSMNYPSSPMLKLAYRCFIEDQFYWATNCLGKDDDDFTPLKHHIHMLITKKWVLKQIESYNDTTKTSSVGTEGVIEGVDGDGSEKPISTTEVVSTDLPSVDKPLDVDVSVTPIPDMNDGKDTHSRDDSVGDSSVSSIADPDLGKYLVTIPNPDLDIEVKSSDSTVKGDTDPSTSSMDDGTNEPNDLSVSSEKEDTSSTPLPPTITIDLAQILPYSRAYAMFDLDHYRERHISQYRQSSKCRENTSNPRNKAGMEAFNLITDAKLSLTNLLSRSKDSTSVIDKNDPLEWFLSDANLDHFRKELYYHTLKDVISSRFSKHDGEENKRRRSDLEYGNVNKKPRNH